MRDGRRNRLGLATGTAYPGENVGNTSTSGLGSFMNVSDLYKNALQKNNLLSDLEGIYGTDLTEQELAAGIKPTAEAASTPTYAIPEFDRYRAASRNYGALPSMYQLYLSGGFPEETTDPVQEFIGGETIDTGTGGGGGGGEGGSNIVDQLGTVDMGGVTGDPITVEDISMNQIPIASEHAGTISGAPEVFDIDETGDPALNMPVDDGMVAGPFDYIQQPAIDAERLAGYNKQEPSLIDMGRNKIDEIGQSISNTLGTAYDAFNNTIDIAGKKINLASTAAKAVLSKYIGGPVTVLIDALSNLPQSDPYASDVLTDKYGITEDGKIAGNPADNVFAGMNATSMFGDQIQSAQDRVDTLQNTYDNYDNQWSNLKETDPAKFNQQKQNIKDKLDKFGGQLNEVENELGDVEGDQPGMTIAEELGLMDEIDPGLRVGQKEDIVDTPVDIVDVQAVEEAIAEAKAQEAAIQAEIDREKRTREAEQAAADRAAIEQAAVIEAQRRDLQNINARGGRDSSGTGGGWGGSATGGGWCFDPNTFVQMADGSEKKIKEIQLGDNTKGGEVTGVFQFKAADEIHDYKGVTVAGSHYVKEDGKFIMVQDSPISVKIDKIPVVYSLDTTGRRIFIKGIEFADYNGDGIAKNFLDNAGLELNGFNKEVLRQVENRLI